MTKQIFFILAVLCTLQAQASIQPVQVDTVQHTHRTIMCNSQDLI